MLLCGYDVCILCSYYVSIVIIILSLCD